MVTEDNEHLVKIVSGGNQEQKMWIKTFIKVEKPYLVCLDLPFD